MRKEMLIYSEASRDPPMKYQVGFLKGLRRPHPFGNSLCCFCCCHPTKVWQRRGHRRGEQRVERSASPRMEQHVATEPGESERGKTAGKTSVQHRNVCQSFLIRALSLIILYNRFW